MRRALKLLHMRYKPSEVADVLGVGVQTVYRVWIPAGCPSDKDSSGALWIVGTELRAWMEDVEDVRRSSKKGRGVRHD